jgi:hypothetical protein
MVWHITNQAMLQQLGVLGDTMHRSYYTLDIFRYQLHYADNKDQAESLFMSLYIQGTLPLQRVPVSQVKELHTS